MQLTSAVIFVRDLEASVRFYRDLLGMKVTVENASATLLVSPTGSQLYLRTIGSDASHPLGGLGVQYVAWTADGREDLNRCESFLKDRSAYVMTHETDGFRMLEGRDPSDLPVMITYPGPDRAPRHDILARIYSW
jgi:catechol 2,3-dioxygenase-like lactoylglutathione lyase family enzyme